MSGVYQVELPPSTAAQEKLYSYLYQLAEQLNAALASVPAETLSTEQERVVTRIATEAAATASQSNTLRSLIIKTADTVHKQMEVLEAKLRSEYLAVSDFGTYQEGLEAQVKATAEGVVQSYNFDSRLEALQQGMVEFESFETSTNQYIKTGLLFVDDAGVPRYGVAVGEKLTTVTVDGQQVLTRTDLMSTFTSDRLSFWQGGVEVAYISSGMLGIGSAEINTRLKVGNYALKRMADGSFGIIFEGG